MKVLRTALLSTLLIICFGDIGYAQLSSDGYEPLSIPSACGRVTLGVVGGSMEYLGNKQVRLIYDATVNNSCGDAMGYTEVVYNGIVLYSESFGNGTFHVNTVVTIPVLIPIGGISVALDCTACEGNLCHREGSVVQINEG